MSVLRAWWVGLQEKVEIPDNREELAFYTVAQLSVLLRDQKITSTELTNIYLTRIKKYSDTLECLITLLEDRALIEAGRADQEIMAGKYRGPLHGAAGGALLPPEITAASFGKLASTRDADLAHALLGMLGENIALICSALTRIHGMETVVFGGSTLSENPILEQTLELITRALGHKVHFLRGAAFCGALGAAALA